MSWAEIMEMRIELADIRKKVGGNAKKFDKDRGERSIDDDVRELRDELQAMKETVGGVLKEIEAMKGQGSVDESSLARIVDALKASNDSLEKAMDEAD